MSITEEQYDWLSLALLPGIGSTQFIKLMARFNTPKNILNTKPNHLQEVVSKKVAEIIHQYKDVVDVNEQIRLMKKCDAQLITLNDIDYPLALAEIYDPPLVLFVRGKLPDTNPPAVAIVGTRKPTPYGEKMAQTLSMELAGKGFTIVSGMAAGIDTKAHYGALKARGNTIAVLGCGVDVVYPKKNAVLMDEIIEHGCLLSRFAMAAPPSALHFPIRNRVISGLSQGTLVVQAPIKSGALITANIALEQGREVFAVPGHVGDVNSQGPHELIRNGAKLVEKAEDVIAELPILSMKCAVRPQINSTKVDASAKMAASSSAVTLNTVENDILSTLSLDGSYVDEIAMACRIPVSEALSTLTMLELKGQVKQFSGKRFVPN
jgi:DNA processing protein